MNNNFFIVFSWVYSNYLLYPKINKILHVIFMILFNEYFNIKIINSSHKLI